MNIKAQKIEGKHVELYIPDTTTELELPLVESGIVAGFPSPAGDYIDLKLDLNKELIRNPSSTFFGRVSGNSMINAGIKDGDILVIDKSLAPKENSILVCFIDGEFTVKRVTKVRDELYLIPDNPEFEPIRVTTDNDFRLWGVVTYSIHKLY